MLPYQSYSLDLRALSLVLNPDKLENCYWREIFAARSDVMELNNR
jgi:hypothetical protein